jgi:hypothetical protein
LNVEDFLIAVAPQPPSEICGVCSEKLDRTFGLQMYRARDRGSVCRSCGRKVAPKLAALLDLAEVAMRAAKIARHNRTWLPLETLLEMTRVAESCCNQWEASA